MHAHIHCTNDKNTNEIEPVYNGVPTFCCSLPIAPSLLTTSDGASLVCPADMLYSVAKEIGDLDHDIMIHKIIYSHLAD